MAFLAMDNGPAHQLRSHYREQAQEKEVAKEKEA